MVGERVEIHAFRRDELMRFEVELRAAPADVAKLALADDAPASVMALREGWLAG